MASAACGSSSEQEEDLVDVLLRLQKEGGLEVPLTMAIIKEVILVSKYTLHMFVLLLFLSTHYYKTYYCWRF